MKTFKNYKKIILAVTLILVGSAILFHLLVKLHTRGLILIFKQDSSNKQGTVIETLNKKLLAGKLSNKDISDTSEIIIDHIGARAQATRKNDNTMPRIWMGEIQYGWNAVKDNLVSENMKMQFLHELIVPRCNYSYHEPDIHHFKLNGEAYISADMAFRYKLTVINVDGKEIEQKVLDEFKVFPKSSGISFGLSGKTNFDSNPDNTMTVKLDALWYSVPVEIMNEFPQRAKNPEDLEKVQSILDKNSIHTICEYSKTTTLKKSENWENYF